MVLRTFHPVGHGAFYSEKHLCGGTESCIVYDCGTLEKKNLVDTVAKDAFSDDEVIDILFISHFDKDHVSLVPELRPFQNRKIKKVVLPLLHDDVKLLLNGYYRLKIGRWRKSDVDISLSILNHPQEFFQDSELIFVSYRNDKLSDVQREIKDITYVKGGIVESGTAISLRKYQGWAFVPYNFDQPNRATALKKQLKQDGIDINRLNDATFVNRYAQKLKTFYKTIGKGINENSMVVYSGPSHSSASFCVCQGRIGCIYTGDFNLKNTSLREVFKAYWSNVGTLQIPHHGSIHSFDESCLKFQRLKCPISASGRFRLPHQDVEVRIAKNGSWPILITADKWTIYREMFCMRGAPVWCGVCGLTI